MKKQRPRPRKAQQEQLETIAGTHGDPANAVLAAAGYNFRRLLEWLALLLSSILVAFTAAASRETPLKSP